MYGLPKNVRVVPVIPVCIKCSLYRFCSCFCMSEIISSFKSLRAGSQVFALLMLFLCVILHTMSSGKSLQLLCILPFDMLCLSVISMMLVQIMLAGRMWWVWWSERKRLCVFRELCPVSLSFLVVGECPSVLL